MGRPSVTRVRLTSGPAAAGTLHRRGLPARLAQLTALVLLGSLLAAPVQASVRVPATALPGSVSGASLTTISPAFAMPTALLNQTLLTLRTKYAIPGMQATIVYPDGRTWTATTGFSNVKARVRVTRATAFSAASITKTFVAALILKLSEAGRLTLDDPLARWVPDLVATYPNLTPTATIRQMMSHMSGLADFYGNPAVDPILLRNPRWTWTAARSLSYVQAPVFTAGTSWSYSNTNFLLLGAIAERAGGATFAAQVRAQFSGPLGLTSTFVQRVDPWRAPTAHGYRFATSSVASPPIDLNDGSATDPFTSVVTAAGAAGDLASSSWDLARWAFALYGGHVLQPASLAEMLDVSASQAVGSSVAYGGGVQVLTVNGLTTYGHGGRFLGARAIMWYQPGPGVAIAVTTNQDRTDPSVIAKALLAIAVPPGS